MDEFDFIRWLQTRASTTAGVEVGVGDDAAVLSATLRRTLVTTDVLTEGVDFHLAEAGAQAIGRKAMAVNLSDIAAMGGRATAAVVGIVASPGLDIRALFEGLEEAARTFGVPIVGGDTNSWTGGLVVSITVLGEPIGEPILRSGAKPGDALFVTGPLGGSILGRHLNPIPRLREVEELLRLAPIHAMIDISDGLAQDLHHICAASRCGAVLRADAIPIHADAHRLALLSGKTALVHALTDGEDFELAFAVPGEFAEQLQRNCSFPLERIGECIGQGYWLEDGGIRQVLEPTGWRHLLGRIK